jgi:hypothetical protein
MGQYNKLTYEELRIKCLCNELVHEYMTENDYGLLLDYECQLNEPNQIIIDFCAVGLNKLELYEDFKALFEKAEKRNTVKYSTIKSKSKESPEKNYSRLLYSELRGMVINGEAKHEYMSEKIYEYLLENEIGNYNDRETHELVINFCIDGLKRIEKYKNLSDSDIYIAAIQKQIEKERIEQEVLNKFYKKRKFTILSPISFIRLLFKEPKLVLGAFKELLSISFKKHRFLSSVIAVISSFFIITMTANAFGFNFLSFFWRALNAPDKTATDSDGRDIFLTDDLRAYNSMSEMLEIEGFNILYPSKLPDGYSFTNFEVWNVDTGMVIRAFSFEPHISFEVMIDVNIQINNFSYTENGIEYNIIDMGEMYQAEWIRNTDYYLIVVSNKTAISEIIKNLKES